MRSFPRGRSRDPRLQVFQDESLSAHSSTLATPSAPPPHSFQHFQQRERGASLEPLYLNGKADTDVQSPVALDGVKIGAVSVNNRNITTDGGNDLGDFLDGMSEAEVGAVMAERTRRLAEQGSMLAARKLCLVLDLDHTLLNSAKVPGRSPDSIAMLSILFTDERRRFQRRTRVSHSRLLSSRSIEWLHLRWQSYF